MDKTELESLLARIDVWLLVFGVIVVIGVAGESYFGIRHWWNSRKLQAIQDAENAALRAEIARLNKEAGDARKAAADAMERAANAERQTAGLNRKAEEERLARVQIEERLAHRKVSPEQARILRSELHKLAGHKLTVTTSALQPEIVEYAKQLADVLRQAGLDASFQGALLPVSQAGFLFVSGPDRMQDAEAIVGAFLKTGMATGKISLQSVSAAGELQIIVGPKE